MKKKIILIFALMTLLLTACNFPSVKNTPTPTPSPTPDNSMQLYQGLGMSIYLPPSYVAEDIKTELPNILETITNLVGSQDGFLGDIINNLEDNISWYGFDGSTPAIYPTRLVVIRNKPLAKTPVSLLTYALERILKGEGVEVDSDTLTINGRELNRFSYAEGEHAWVAYIFNAEDQLWLSVFITTPANLAASLKDYDTSIGSIVVEPLPAE